VFKSLAITRKIGVVVAATIAITGATTGALVANAATSIPSGTIHGCVQLTNGVRALEYVYTNPDNHTSCPKGMMLVVWSITGPKGATGPTGPAGPAGPQGNPGVTTAGPSGLNVVEVIASGGQYATMETAQCPASNPYLLGGGGTGGGAAMLTDSGTESYVLNGSVMPAQWIVIRALADTGDGMSAEAFCAQ
jgi:hypothetical protein